MPTQGNSDRRCFFEEPSASGAIWLPTGSTAVARPARVRLLRRQIRNQPGPQGHDGGAEGQQSQKLSLHQRKSKSSSDSPEKAFMIRAEKGMKTAAITKISIDASLSIQTLLNIPLQMVIKRTIHPSWVQILSSACSRSRRSELEKGAEQRGWVRGAGGTPPLQMENHDGMGRKANG